MSGWYQFFEIYFLFFSILVCYGNLKFLPTLQFFNVCFFIFLSLFCFYKSRYQMMSQSLTLIIWHNSLQLLLSHIPHDASSCINLSYRLYCQSLRASNGLSLSLRWSLANSQECRGPPPPTTKKQVKHACSYSVKTREA